MHVYSYPNLPVRALRSLGSRNVAHLPTRHARRHVSLKRQWATLATEQRCIHMSLERRRTAPLTTMQFSSLRYQPCCSAPVATRFLLDSLLHAWLQRTSDHQASAKTALLILASRCRAVERRHVLLRRRRSAPVLTELDGEAHAGVRICDKALSRYAGCLQPKQHSIFVRAQQRAHERMPLWN